MHADIVRQLGQWYPLVADLFQSDLMENIGKHLGADIDNLSPSFDKIFRAYELTAPQDVKVVILGQDPYPTKGHATGLSFSSGNGTIPYSLVEIFKALEEEGFGKRTNPVLDDWAAQGVLMLNTVLTTRIGETKAHTNIGWQKFVAHTLNQLKDWPVYMLWGKDAQNFLMNGVNFYESYSISTQHPASVRYGNIFSPQFKQVNKYLIEMGKTPIIWNP